ncbi:P2 family phage contractile tail tube protein [Sphingomonas kyeonggiensis]|uniref:phage major tail tube protein n=1 Tax=Sphingomonas kyeonggiensis TaxID=1268553 RepID=UPI00278A8562|nr:phage major tail tube protein [Sphingomonas kyeonggiensis]MDQ0250954.1 P2 family phage contractile tail tube protein [Sphingomonas kyeonggiensis]
MGLPHKLKNFTVYNAGDNYLGKVPEIELPKLALKVEQYRAAGMLGEIDIALGLEKLEMTTKYGGLVVAVMRQFGEFGVSGIQQRFVGWYQEEELGTAITAEIVTRGMHTEIDLGTAKTGDNTEHAVKSTLTYFKLIVNGAALIEIDMISGLFIVGGVDRSAAMRAALQL